MSEATPSNTQKKVEILHAQKKDRRESNSKSKTTENTKSTLQTESLTPKASALAASHQEDPLRNNTDLSGNLSSFPACSAASNLQIEKTGRQSFIFLDIDGVVHPRYGEKGEFLPKHMSLVKKIAHDADAKIVLSSTWRETPEDLAVVEKQFDLNGLPKLVGCTPRGTCRAAEICTWLENKFGSNAIDSCCFVALDDDDLVDHSKWGSKRDDTCGKILAAGHFVKTDRMKALTPADAEEVVRLLRVQQQKQCRRKRASKARANTKSSCPTESSKLQVSTPAPANTEPSDDADTAKNDVVAEKTDPVFKRRRACLALAVDGSDHKKSKLDTGYGGQPDDEVPMSS